MDLTLDKAKSALKMKLSEYEMLNKTLLEMIEKSSGDIAIDTLKHNIDETLDTINELREWIEKEADKEDNKVEYSFYDKIEKPKLAKSVKLASFAKSSDGINEEFKNDNKEDKLNYEGLYKNKLPIYRPYDNVIQDNRFLVRFGTPFNIPEYFVRSVDFLYNDKQLMITVLNNVKKDKRPIIAELLARKYNPNNKVEFSILIYYLDATGVTLYTERYHNCHLVNIDRESMDCTRDDLNGILLTISYSDITYETSH